MAMAMAMAPGSLAYEAPTRRLQQQGQQQGSGWAA
jgi:hypothetical protein